MEGKKILLMLVLFLGVSLADEVPGFFRDKSVPNKLDLGLWKKHKARDQHEREDTRTMKAKQTEASNDIEVRHKLPIQHKAGLLPENDVTYTPFCHYKVIPKVFHPFVDQRGNEYFPVGKYYETVCDPPDDDTVMIGQVARQRCELELHHHYCFSKEEELPVTYKARTRGGDKSYTKKEKLRIGCECGSLDVRKR